MPGHVRVFVSYSHVDASLVTPVVRLLRINQSLVFKDADDIAPGKRWREEIASALFASDLVVVFWCQHACQSDEVSSEWRTAIEQKKDVLPLLLDATPLPSELSAFQWIDFRGTVGGSHGPITAPAEAGEPRRPAPMAPQRGRVGWTAFGVAIVAVLMLSGIWTLRGDRSSLLLLGAIIALAACLLGWREWSRERKRSARAAQRAAEELEHRIATQIETEIVRRTHHIYS